MTTAAEFNAAHELGTLVRFWPGFRTGPGLVSTTRTPAWEMNANDTVVSVTHYAGGIALTHVELVYARVQFDTNDTGDGTVWWAACAQCKGYTGFTRDNVEDATADAQAHMDARHSDVDVAPLLECEGSSSCPADFHTHGCYADTGICDERNVHRFKKVA
jgi:hypothetical protein